MTADYHAALSILFGFGTDLTAVQVKAQGRCRIGRAR